jgi:hypothetical protein
MFRITYFEVFSNFHGDFTFDFCVNITWSENTFSVILVLEIVRDVIFNVACGLFWLLFCVHPKLMYLL